MGQKRRGKVGCYQTKEVDKHKRVIKGGKPRNTGRGTNAKRTTRKKERHFPHESEIIHPWRRGNEKWSTGKKKEKEHARKEIGHYEDSNKRFLCQIARIMESR